MSRWRDRVGPPVVVESELLDLLDLSRFRGKRLGICGVYGDLCVLNVAPRLAADGFDVTLLVDACLWSGPLEWIQSPDTDWYKPALARFKPLSVSDPDNGLPSLDRNSSLWRGPAPHLNP